MPYIESQVDRDSLDYLIKSVASRLAPDGHLNYFLYALCKRTIKPSYNSYKNYIGELRQCATEIERRLLAPYEDIKIQENGDVL